MEPNKNTLSDAGCFCGAAGGARTPDPLFRRQMLYPTELRPHIHAKMLRQILTLVNHSGILMPSLVL